MQNLLRQPNGHYAMFDKRFVSLSLDMRIGEARERFRDIRDRVYSQVEREVRDAKADAPFDFGLVEPEPFLPTYPHRRWNEVLTLVRAVRGDAWMRRYLAEAGCPEYELVPVSEEFQRDVDAFVEMMGDELKDDPDDDNDEDAVPPPAP